MIEMSTWQLHQLLTCTEVIFTHRAKSAYIEKECVEAQVEALPQANSLVTRNFFKC